MSYIGNPINSVAFLTDQFSGNGSTTAFTMSVAPANTASVIVAVSGVLQDPSTYSVVGTTLTFSAAPPSGTGNISVRYLGIPAAGVTTTAYRTVTEFTATAAQTAFSVPSYTVGYISVFRNGVLLGSADYTASNGTTVVLAVGAAAGDLITTESFYVSSVLNAIANTNGSVTQLNLAPNVAGNGPAFSAWGSTVQACTTGANTKIILNNELFDTANCFDSATNYRFTPNVAGYYQISGACGMAAGSASQLSVISIWKNGGQFFLGSCSPAFTTIQNFMTVSGVVYLNGTTDYVELYVYHNFGSTWNTTPSQVVTWFNGALVRAA